MISGANRGKYTVGFLKTELALVDYSMRISRTRYTCEDAVNFLKMIIPIIPVAISVAFGVTIAAC